MTKIRLVSFHSTKKNWSIFNKVAPALIKLWTRSKYYHTELLIGNLRISSFTKNGVKVDRVNLLVYDRFIKNIATTLDVQIDQSSVTSMIDFAGTQIGMQYDWKGIVFSQFLPLKIEDKDKRFCSEVVAAVLKKGGLSNIIVENPSEYDPGELERILNR